jgi:hypothetical protein
MGFVTGFVTGNPDGDTGYLLESPWWALWNRKNILLFLFLYEIMFLR